MASRLETSILEVSQLGNWLMASRLGDWLGIKGVKSLSHSGNDFFKQEFSDIFLCAKLRAASLYFLLLSPLHSPYMHTRVYDVILKFVLKRSICWVQSIFGQIVLS